MIHPRRRQPTVDQATHPAPGDTAVLAAARKRSMPEPAYSEPERAQRRAVHGHSVIADVSTYDRVQPLAHFRDGIVHAPPEFAFHLIQLRLHPLTNRLPQHREVPVAPLLPADMREAKEIERFRLPFSAPLSVSSRARSEFQKPRLVGMQLKLELPKPLGKFRPKPLRIRFALESNHESSRPGELHPQALTDSGLERLRSSGSYRPVAARRSNGQ